MKYTMKDFIEKPIAVRLKKENAESFLVACGKKWNFMALWRLCNLRYTYHSRCSDSFDRACGFLYSERECRQLG